MVPMWFFPITIAAGNTVVLKPSEKDVGRAIGRTCGCRLGCRMVSSTCAFTGDKVAVDAADQPRRRVVVFVGSIAQYVLRPEPCTASGCKPSAAREPCCVLPDADLDLTADAMVNTGFGSGRRAMQRSRPWWPSSRSPTNWWPRSPNAPGPSRSATAPAARYGTAIGLPAHRDRVALTSRTPAWPRHNHRRGRSAPGRWEADEKTLAGPHVDRPRDRDAGIYTDGSSARCCRWSGRGLRRTWNSSTRTVRQRHAIFTCDGGLLASSRTRCRSG